MLNPISSRSDGLHVICGFHPDAKNFLTRYVYTESGITPCAELFLLSVDHFILLFFTVLAFWEVHRSSRIPSRRVRIIIIGKASIALATSVLLLIAIGLTQFTSNETNNLKERDNAEGDGQQQSSGKVATQIEYGLMALVWGIFACVWHLSLRYNAWTRPVGLSIAYGFVSPTAFSLIAIQRLLRFGISDMRTIIPATCLFIHAVNYLLCFAEFVLARQGVAAQERLREVLLPESTTNSQQLQQQRRVRLPEGGDESAGWLSKLLFCWTNSLISKGYRGQLQRVEDLFEAPPSMRLLRIERQFHESAPSHYTDAEPFSFTKALIRAFGAQYFALALLRLVGDALKFAGPVFLHLLINCLQVGGGEEKGASQSEPLLEAGYLYAGLLAFTSLLSALCDFAFNFHVNKVALKVRYAMMLAVYDKLLQVPLWRLSSGEGGSGDNGFSSGQLINFMSTDVDRIVGACTSFHASWSMPLNLAAALYLLYREVGWAALSGLLAAVLLVPVNKYIALKIGSMSEKMLTFKDQRVKLLTEVIRAIRVVKLNNWEPHFLHRIDAIRQSELYYLKARKYLDALCVYLWASAPLLITLAIILTFTSLMGEQLTAAKVFTSLALVQILIVPLNSFPWVLNSMVEAWVSKRRFDFFFALSSVEPSATYVLVRNGDDNLLELDRACFTWNVNAGGADCCSDGDENESEAENSGAEHSSMPHQPAFSTRGLTMEGRSGCVIGIVGPVGAGKSTILLGILGESRLVTALHAHTANPTSFSPIRIRQESIHEGFAYVGQECWLRRGSVRENILCGTRYQQEFYKRVLRAVALEADLAQMPHGDEWVIGDEGATLSGGQRARMALARAVYQDNSIYLLDDPFASLDVNVARYVWTNCIDGMLRKRGKLVLLATHNLELLTQADWVVRLNADGSMAEAGLPGHVLREAIEEAANLDSPRISLPWDPPKENGEDEEDPFDPNHRLGNAAQPSSDEPSEDMEEGSGEEEKDSGTVRIHVYVSYLQATGYWLVAAICLALLLMQASRNASDLWLSEWTIDDSHDNTTAITNPRATAGKSVQPLDWSFPFGTRVPIKLDEDIDRRNKEGSIASTGYGRESAHTKAAFFLSVYVGVAAANTLFTLLRAFLFAYGGIVAARRLHERLLQRVMQATLVWWDSTPWGRVVNRLCSDVYQVDDSLPFQLNICLASLFGLLGTLLITCVAIPLLIPLVVGLLILYHFIQRYYRYTTCELKRIQSLTLSPLYGHITDTVLGLVTVRAQRFVERFTHTLRRLLEANLRAQYSSLAASQWLSVRLQLLGVGMVSVIAFAGLLEAHLMGMHTGLIALAITYALSITGQLNALLCSFIETERELVSVERISDYVSSTPLEEGSDEVARLDRLLYCRAVAGQIDFTCVSMRYSAGQPWALKNVTFRIEAGHRVGIIGKTGAGKSSIFQALLRARPIETGKILIDGAVDLCQLDSRAARSLFGYVAQQPFLFSGTLRENLCVELGCNGAASTRTDAELISLLTRAALAPEWLERHGGLDGCEVREGGANFSFGERQIIGLCRLILARPRIVLIDEATAHMDERTHVAMLRLLGELLPGTTVLSIVHRTLGLEQFDWVVEMSGGAVHRQGRSAMFQPGMMPSSRNSSSER